MRDRSPIERLEPRLLFATGEMIRNGSLEGVVASADWVLNGAFQADARFTTVNSGLGYAYLATPAGAAADNLVGQMYQQLTIPASAAQLKLSFWTRITTAEASGAPANDLLKVRVWNSAGTTLLHTAATLSSRDASSAYVKRTYTLPDSLKGQTVRILFDGSTNASNATTFRVDDIGLSTQLPDTSKKVVGYVPYYRQSLFAQMDLNLVTHINYFSVQASGTGALTTTNVNDANLATVVNAAHAKGIGVSIVVGPHTFATLAADPAARTTFANNIVNYALARNLDGIDIDWEPPATGAAYANYALLIDDLYKKTAPAGLKITAAVNPWNQEIPVAATNQMDWVNVMCYDFDYANNSTYEAAIDGMIQWSDYGVEKHKLLMGTPFYGRSGTSWSATASKTYGSFYNEYLAKNGQPPSPDTDVFVDTAGKTWIVNGVTTIQRKMAWVRDNGYGGAMIWELGQDHWDGATSPRYDEYSLLPVINSMLRPPSWLTPAAGSRFQLVGTKFIHSFGNVTFSGNANALNPNLAVTIRAGATAILDATQRWSSTAIAAGGKLDITDEDLVINYTGASPIGTWNGSAYTGITGLIQSAYHFSAWDGSGITSSMPGARAGLTTVAAAEARDVLFLSGGQTQLWNGQTADSTSVLIKYTYAGDANLDGIVNASDYGIIDSYYASPGMTGFYNGDFNFDGVIDAGDYGIIDNAYQLQGLPL